MSKIAFFFSLNDFVVIFKLYFEAILLFILIQLKIINYLLK